VREKKAKSLTWDDGPPWELCLAVEQDEESGEWIPRGRLRRDGETLDFQSTELLLPGGLVITRESISRLQDFGAFEWVKLLSRKVDCSVINAGDGTHEHPTQALLDALSIRRHKGTLEGLKVAIRQYELDGVIAGIRRDEQSMRAKERVFSFRTATHRWDPKNQRPELWNLYNGYKSRGESIRVFPLSNWTELDIWQYIYREQIPIVPLYFAAERPVVERDGMIIMVDDDRMRLFPDDRIELRKVRFRTLGCYPLTGAFESDADDLSAIVLELLQSRTSERQGRAIDSDAAASMEKKKQEGYF